MIKFIKLLLVFSWMAVIFISSSVSFPEEDPNYVKNAYDYIFDKDVHILLFGILAYLVIHFLVEYKLKFLKFFLIVVTIGFLYGITDEWHQSFVLGRGVSVWDLVFDVIGSILGFLVYRGWHVIKKKRGWHARKIHIKGIL